MGIAASLFFDSNDAEKQTLYRRVTPTETQYEEQQDRWNSLAEHMISDLAQRSGLTIRTWLQGSYKFGTQIRPVRSGEEFDIDLGVYFEWAGTADGGHLGPKDIKTMVQDCLQKVADEAVIEVVEPPKKRCCRIRFEGEFHIDVPAYHLDNESDTRMLATEDDNWENSDPKALYAWFVESFDDARRAKVRRAIKYVKCWAALKFALTSGRPSSTILTILVAEAACELPDEALISDDDALLQILRTIIDRLQGNRSILNPANPAEKLSDQLTTDEYDTFVRELTAFRDLASAALAQTDSGAAADKWSEAFEHFFPMPEEDLKKSTAEGRQLVVHGINPEVAVTATARNNPLRKWEGMNEIGPIPKDCTIVFRITNFGMMPAGAVVEWTVRNESNEAEYLNDLGHKAGVGLIATERSAYKGLHYMDCVIKLNGRIIGRRRIPVTITGAFMPRRNPTKPRYVALRGLR